MTTSRRSTPTLAGVLSGFALADVLQLLELGARSGYLDVDGGPLHRGTVRLRAGRVVAVANAAHVDVAADARIGTVAGMLEWTAGRWAFHASDDAEALSSAANGDDGLAITAILVEAARRRDETACGAECPSPVQVDVPVLADDEADGDGPPLERLTAIDLQVLAAVDGSRDLIALAAVTRRDVTHVIATIARLRACGVLRARSIPRGFAHP